LIGDTPRMNAERTHETAAGGEKLLQPNAKQQYEVTSADLPLACPMPGMHLWNSHPRVFLPIEASKLLFGYDEGYPWVGLRLSDPDAAEDFVKQLETEERYVMQSWIKRNGTYVTALVVERNVMRLILFIVVVVLALLGGFGSGGDP